MKVVNIHDLFLVSELQKMHSKLWDRLGCNKLEC